MATNNEYILSLLKAHPTDDFHRSDILSSDDAKKLSPYLTYAVRAGLIERLPAQGTYRKLPGLNEPIDYVTALMTKAQKQPPSVNGVNRARKPIAPSTPAEKQPVEVDVFEVLDQLPVEGIFDVLAAKINLLTAKAAPLSSEISALRDQVNVRDGKIQSLKIDVLRLEEKQRALNAENARLTALFTNTRQERIVLVKPVHAQTGTAVFRDGERRTIVLRKQGGSQ